MPPKCLFVLSVSPVYIIVCSVHTCISKPGRKEKGRKMKKKKNVMDKSISSHPSIGTHYALVMVFATHSRLHSLSFPAARPSIHLLSFKLSSVAEKAANNLSTATHLIRKHWQRWATLLNDGLSDGLVGEKGAPQAEDYHYHVNVLFFKSSFRLATIIQKNISTSQMYLIHLN